MSLSRVSLHFDFKDIPFSAGIQRIHSPETIVSMHSFGASFFRIDAVERPKFDDERVSITFGCSTPFISNMKVRMFSSQPHESNMFFFKDGRALYIVKFSVAPTRAFKSHRLQLDVSFCGPIYRTTLKSLLPVLFFLNNERADCNRTVFENRNFTEYRRGVLRGPKSDGFWIMAERAMREHFF